MSSVPVAQTFLSVRVFMLLTEKSIEKIMHNPQRKLVLHYSLR